MNPAISVELQFFLTSILWGVILLIAYDVLRIFRRLIKHDAFFIAIEDLIFWVIASLFIFAMIYRMNNGIIRGFSIMGMLLGGVLYHFTFSDLLVKSVAKLIKVLLSPAAMVLLQMKRFFMFILLKVRKLINNLLDRLKKLSKSVKIALKKRKNKPENSGKPEKPGKSGKSGKPEKPGKHKKTSNSQTEMKKNPKVHKKDKVSRD